MRIVRSLMISAVLTATAVLGGCVTNSEMASMTPAQKTKAESCNRSQTAGAMLGLVGGLGGALIGSGIGKLSNSDCQTNPELAHAEAD